MQFYILVNEEQQGPFTVEQIKGYLAMGHYQHTDLAWHEGLPEWKPLGEFPEFAPKAHRTPNYQSVPVRQVAQKKSGKGKAVLTGVLTVVILGAVGGGGYYYWNTYMRKTAATGGTTAAGAPAPAPAAENPGDPKTLEELNAWYAEPPAGQNAATYFQQGFDALQITNADRNSSNLPLIGRAAMPPINYPVPLAVKNTLKGFLERNQPALDLFARGAQCSGSRYPLDLTKGANLLLPHLAGIKQAAQLGAVNALFQAEAHKGAEAAQGVSVALASARSLESEPLLISQLVRVAAEGVAEESLEQTLNRVALTADSLTQLQSAFGHSANYEADGTGFNRALAAERLTAASAFDLPADKLRETISQASAATGAAAMPAAEVDKLLANLKDQKPFFTESINQFIIARKEPFPARLKADDLVASRVEEAKSKQFVVAAALVPALAKATSKEAGGLARLRLAQTAVALEQFRAANTNHYPAALAELSPKFLPAAPTDPFDGQPLRYRKAGEGFVIYSIGPDLKDDSGARKPGSDDLSFVVVRPPKAAQ